MRTRNAVTAPSKPRLSAHALKELDHCGRKFALKYLRQAFWPGTAPEDHDGSVQLALGQAFHHLVQVHALGLDVASALAALGDADGRLAALWRAFEGSVHAVPPAGSRVWTEQQLNFFVNGVPFNVRYDRVVEHNGKWTILDWKTGNLNAVKMTTDWQTRLYRFALVEAGVGLGAGTVPPTAVTLVYWDVERGRPLEFAYDQATYAADGLEFAQKARRVLEPFNPRVTDDAAYQRNDKHCKVCGFDSMCNRETDAVLPIAEISRRPRFVLGTLPP
jgi:hypothetical protein